MSQVLFNSYSVGPCWAILGAPHAWTDSALHVLKQSLNSRIDSEQHIFHLIMVYSSLPIITGIQSVRSMNLSSGKARSVSVRLLEAMRYGKTSRDVHACEAAYNRYYCISQPKINTHGSNPDARNGKKI